MDRQLALLTVAVVAALVVTNVANRNRSSAVMRAQTAAQPAHHHQPPLPPASAPQSASAVTGRSLGYANASWHSPRLHLRNDVDAILWPAEDVERKEAVLQSVLAHCRDRTRQSDIGRKRQLRMLGIQGMASGRWNRFWAVADCPMGTRPSTSAEVNQTSWAPCCSGGDMLDVQMESPVAKVAVDRVYDIEDTGIYEVQLYLRKKHPSYTLVVHLKASGVRWFRMANKSMQVLDGDGRIVHTPFPLGGHSTTVAVTRGEDVVPIQRSCTARSAFDDQGDGAIDFRDRFRFGAWHRLDSNTCDGVHCDGSTTALGTEQWVWASDLCRVQLFAPDEVARRLLNKPTFAWGASTLRQPLTILNAAFLGGEQRNESSAHPLWWAWSGCTNTTQRNIARCKAEGSGVGFSTWKSRPAEIFANASRPFDHVLIERTTWLSDGASEALYFSELATWLALYRASLKMRTQPQPPVQIFHNFVASAYAGKSNSLATHFNRHWSWLLEDYMIANAPEFAFISRQEMTLPLHFGGTFAHNSVHYGSSGMECAQASASGCQALMNSSHLQDVWVTASFKEMDKAVCSIPWIRAKRRALQAIRSGGNRKKIDWLVRFLGRNLPEVCVRKVHGDAAVVVAWLNILLADGG